METKQTAVEWFFDKLENHEIQAKHYDLYHQAKAMEKEQMKGAYRVGRIDGDIPFEFNHTFEKYYEETYGTRQSNN